MGFFDPSGVTYDPDNDAIYVINRGTNSISVINSTTHSPVKTIPSGGVCHHLQFIILLMDWSMSVIQDQTQYLCLIPQLIA
ncbi:MAG: hypothetical protein JO297_14760 [Nitrososphaeraceae archaeon]|nr:hypothetical protein [Nitrososphaeraceae archaeon]